MGDAAPKVSVLVPVYNDAVHLPRALASILAQSEQDLEVVVSDDASTDDTFDVATAWAARDARIKVIRQERNLGMTANWNAALASARGRFVCKLDSDDAFSPRAIEYLLRGFRDHPAAMATFCRTLLCDDQLAPVASYPGDFALDRARRDPFVQHADRGHAWYALAFDDIQLWHSNAMMFPTAVLRKLNGWDPRFGCASDTDLILRVLERDDVVVHQPYASVLYRIREGSVSHRYRRERRLALEGAIVHLASLQRYVAAGGVLTAHQRFAWARMWSSFRSLKDSLDVDASSVKGNETAALASAAAQLKTPPLSVRMRMLRGRLTSKLRRILRRDLSGRPRDAADETR